MATLGNFTSAVLTAAELNAIDDLTSWSTSWTNVTVGNGTVSSKYTVIQNTLRARVSLVFGTTTSISGIPTITLPSGWVTDIVDGPGPVGGVNFHDTGVQDYYGIVRSPSTTTVDFVLLNVAGTYPTPTAPSATVPHTWGTGDSMVAHFALFGTF